MKTSCFRLVAPLAFACVLAVVHDFADAADSALANAINLSGRQRMLTQRIVKAYAQLGQGITPDVSKRQLDDATRHFDVQLAHLRKIATDKQSARSLARLDRLWRPFKAAAQGEVDQPGAKRLLAMEEELLDAAHELTVVLQNLGESPVGRLVNTSGRQRMLSQRMAKFYLLRAWGLESPVISREIGSARTEFEGALAVLRSAPENTAEIARELDAVVVQWEWFKSALGLQGAASYSLIVVNASESILESMELITSRYEQLAAR